MSTRGVVGLVLFALQPAGANQRVKDAGLGALAIADQHVVERRGITEERRRLERAREAETRDLVRLQRRDVVAVEHDASARCRQRAADHVEERRLAGAVRPDDAGDRSGGDREVDLVNGAESAERLAEPMRLEQHHRGFTGPSRGRVSERIAPARPAGMKRINSTSARPKITIWYCCSTASTCDSP